MTPEEPAIIELARIEWSGNLGELADGFDSLPGLDLGLITRDDDGSCCKKSGNATVSYFPSNRIWPLALRMQIWDFLPPRSIAQCSMAGSFRLRLERGTT